MSDKYILEGKECVLCPDLIEWATWSESANRVIVRETVGDMVERVKKKL